MTATVEGGHAIFPGSVETYLRARADGSGMGMVQRPGVGRKIERGREESGKGKRPAQRDERLPRSSVPISPWRKAWETA